MVPNFVSVWRIFLYKIFFLNLIFSFVALSTLLLLSPLRLCPSSSSLLQLIFSQETASHLREFFLVSGATGGSLVQEPLSMMGSSTERQLKL